MDHALEFPTCITDQLVQAIVAEAKAKVLCGDLFDLVCLVEDHGVLSGEYLSIGLLSEG
jgi:hypothetical protein